MTPYTRRRGRPRRLPRQGHPLLARTHDARADLRGALRRVAGRLRGGNFHRVHGTAGAGAHHARRQVLFKGAPRFQTGHRRTRIDRLDFRRDPDAARQARAAPGDGDRVRRGDPLRRASRGPGRRDGRRRNRAAATGRARTDCRQLPPGARASPRAISGKRCRCTGSCTSGRSPNSTAGTR